MKKYFFLLLCSSLLISASAQKIEVSNIEPSFWWTGMKNQHLQLMVYGRNIKNCRVEINYPGITYNRDTTSNPDYLFINLTIAPQTKAGKFAINLKQGRASRKLEYELKPRVKSIGQAGFSPADVLYLIMPDRFANGDTTNDNISGMEALNRSKPDGRHGGDLAGIMQHLNYLKELGVTTIWLNPVQENNMKAGSYHGYAITNFYAIDKRLGKGNVPDSINNKLYKNFVDSCHKNGLKVVMDVVLNHCGFYHTWLQHQPALKEFVHDSIMCSYAMLSPNDPHASDADLNLMMNGWFVPSMPDLNHSNPFLATYLIQNNIWWIEYSGIDGIRLDTQVFNDKGFTSDWAKAIRDEFPNFSLVGEILPDIKTPAYAAYFQHGNNNADGYDSYMNAVTDYPMYEGLIDAIKNSNAYRLYQVPAQDYVYANPNSNLIFAGNHDMDRFYSAIGRDFNKFKMGIAYILTTRGIPQLYYGDELAMSGDRRVNDGFVRTEFPGGWSDADCNAFTGKNLGSREQEALEFTRKLLNWRKSQPALHSGQLKHFVPQDNVYTYFRYNESQCVMILLNFANETKTIETKRFSECLKNYSKAKEIISGTSYAEIPANLSLPPLSVTILELQK